MSTVKVTTDVPFAVDQPYANPLHDSAVHGHAAAELEDWQIDGNRPTKRRKLTSIGADDAKEDLLVKFTGDIYLVLGGQRAADLDGLEQVAT